MSEKLWLQWNDFKKDVKTSFGSSGQGIDSSDVTLACEDGEEVKAYKLAEKVKSMMEKTSSATPDGKRRLYLCKVCGKEGQSINVQKHIESKHLEGASLPCNVCGKTSRSRRALQTHKQIYKSQIKN